MTAGTELEDADVVLPDRSLVAVVGRRITGHHGVDEWGLDQDLCALVGSLPGMGHAVVVEGIHLLPDGPAVLVHDRTPLGFEAVAVAVGVGVAADRPVRTTGVPDVAPVVGVLRRLGGVGGHPADLRGLLRSGQLVAVGLTPVRARPGRTGVLPPDAVAAALATGAPLVPVSVRPARGPRRARVTIGESVPTRRRRSARAADEVAGLVRDRIAELAGVAALGVDDGT